jgi:hypothetical protein
MSATASPPPERNRGRRVLKARRAGRLACGCTVQVGEPIVKIGQAWLCARCVVAGIAEHAEPDGPWHD